MIKSLNSENESNKNKNIKTKKLLLSLTMISACSFVCFPTVNAADHRIHGVMKSIHRKIKMFLAPSEAAVLKAEDKARRKDEEAKRAHDDYMETPNSGWSGMGYGIPGGHVLNRINRLEASALKADSRARYLRNKRFNAYED